MVTKMKKYFSKIFKYQSSVVYVFIFALVTILCVDSADIFWSTVKRITLEVGVKTEHYVFCGIGFVIILVILLRRKHFFDLIFKIKTVNLFDYIILYSFFSLLLMILALIVINQYYCYKIVFLVLSTVLLAILLLFRCKQCTNSNTIDEKQYNVIELKDIYDNNINNNGLPIIVSEKAVDYDLLNRNDIVNNLVHSVKVASAAQEPFVIGLSGKWGCGKTTVLNCFKMVYDNNNCILIDEFDPWTFGTQESMLISLLDRILFNLNIKYSGADSRKLIKSILSVLSEKSSFVKLGSALFDNVSPCENIDNLKKEINEYLDRNNKTVVFIIDNIERANADNIIFLFKLIGDIFDIKRIVYVLSYDKERLNDIFSDTLKVNPRFTEKIINQEIIIPPINSSLISNLYDKCMTNLLLYYGVDEVELKQYKTVLEFLIKYITDLREFKRIINSAFFVSFRDNDLYKPDLLAMEIIRFLNIGLFNEIYYNRQYFIDCDLEMNQELYLFSFRKDEFNKLGEEFFDNLFVGDNKNYISLLSELFSYVKRYSENKKLRDDNYSRDYDYKKTELFSRVNSTKFFELYMSYGRNAFLDNNVFFMDFTKKLDSSKQSEIDELVNDTIKTMPQERQKEFFEKLYLYIDNIDETVLPIVLNALCKCIYMINDDHEFMSLSARERAILIMSDMFLKVTLSERERLLDELSSEIGCFYIIEEIRRWIKKEEHEEEYELLTKYLRKMFATFSSDNINLFDDKYFDKTNFESVLIFAKSESELDDDTPVREFIKLYFEPRFIYKALLLALRCSISTNYCYSFSKKSLHSVFDDSINIDKCIVDNTPKSNAEKLLKEIYDIYKDHPENEFEQNGIESDNPIRFDL